jgi:hypothetical protein
VRLLLFITVLNTFIMNYYGVCNSYMGTTSPRLNDINLHHGVVVASSPRERRQQSTIGPGSYFTADDTETAGGGDNALLKKSHNRRVSGGNERGTFNLILLFLL